MDRARLEKIVGLLGSNYDGEPDGVAISALRKIQQAARDEKKTMAELLMTGGERIVYQERVVYRDRPESPGSHFRRAQQEWQAEQERKERERRADREREREARRERAEEHRRRQYGGAFDDAEMSDAEREAMRGARAEKKAGGRRGFGGDREILDGLKWALEQDDGDLTHWEIEFCQNVPFQYRADWELSDSQAEVADRIIRKVRRNKAGSPI